jgi:hypothetical protein
VGTEDKTVPNTAEKKDVGKMMEVDLKTLEDLLTS